MEVAKQKMSSKSRAALERASKISENSMILKKSETKNNDFGDDFQSEKVVSVAINSRKEKDDCEDISKKTSKNAECH